MGGDWIKALQVVVKIPDDLKQKFNDLNLIVNSENIDSVHLETIKNLYRVSLSF